MPDLYGQVTIRHEQAASTPTKNQLMESSQELLVAKQKESEAEAYEQSQQIVRPKAETYEQSQTELIDNRDHRECGDCRG